MRVNEVPYNGNGSQLKRQAEKNLADRWGGALSSRNEDSDKAFYWILGALGAIVLCAAVGCWLWVGQSTKSSSNEADEISKMMQADQEAEKERVAQLERDKAEREELERNNKAEEAKRMLAERAEKEIEAADKEAEAIKAAAQKEREEAVRKQNEETRQAEEEMANAREENLKVPLDKLKITKVIDKTQMEGVRNFEIVEGKKPDLERYLLAEHAALVTNENSVVVYYAENGKVNSAKCHYATRRVKAFGNSKPKTKYSLEDWPDKAKDSPWIVVCVVNAEGCAISVLWSWNGTPQRRAWFEEMDTVNLKKECFACDEAYDLYAQHSKAVYKISWSHCGFNYSFCDTSSQLGIDRLMSVWELQIKSEQVDEKLQKKIAELSKKVNLGHEVAAEVSALEDELEVRLSERKFAKTAQERKDISYLIDSTRDKICSLLEMLDIKDVDPKGAAGEKKKLLELVQRQISRLKDEINHLRIYAEDNRRREGIGAADEDKLRKLVYSVTVVDEGENPTDPRLTRPKPKGGAR